MRVTSAALVTLCMEVMMVSGHNLHVEGKQSYGNGWMCLPNPRERATFIHNSRNHITIMGIAACPTGLTGDSLDAVFSAVPAEVVPIVGYIDEKRFKDEAKTVSHEIRCGTSNSGVTFILEKEPYNFGRTPWPRTISPSTPCNIARALFKTIIPPAEADPSHITPN